MQTSAQTTESSNPRAERLHAMWQRRTARFREAYYAFRLSDEHCDRVGPCHPTYRQARDLARCALRRMDIINRQSMRLARMQISAVGLATTAVATSAIAAESASA